MNIDANLNKILTTKTQQNVTRVIMHHDKAEVVSRVHGWYTFKAQSILFTTWRD